jgi:ethanolamine utilization microcompartment shell protein EutS
MGFSNASNALKEKMFIPKYVSGDQLLLASGLAKSNLELFTTMGTQN